MEKIIECVPNFSEGRDKGIINSIVEAIKEGGKGIGNGVKVLDVDPGEATNRTVVTFVGSPEAVLEAAFQGVRKAGELIDMRLHHGAHPRSGATDVLPLVPVSGITLAECAELARSLAERIFRELEIPCYCYESAAFKPERKNLAVCRAGEYEALPEKMSDPAKAPDFGPGEFTERAARCGATNVGARNFLIAVNYNLNTTSTRRANAIAFDVREKGRPKREGNPVTGKIVKDENGHNVMIPGTLKGCKAIGWYIDEYGIAQVSMNITDIDAAPLHIAFDEVCRAAAARGIRVTGAEIVGLMPKKVLIDAGKYYLEKQCRSIGIPESDIINIAVKSMGLDDLKPFNAREKVIEYIMEDSMASNRGRQLIDLSCKGFALETSRESPAPGGGSVAAYMGSLAAALGTMTANLASHKPGWDDQWKKFSDRAAAGQSVMTELLALVDEDTEAFNRVMAAFGMPKGNPEEIEERNKAIEAATTYAAEVPLKTMKTAFKTYDLLEAMSEDGNPSSISDAGVGALAATAAIRGACLNVKINASSLKTESKAAELTAEAQAIEKEAMEREARIMKTVNDKL